MGAGPGMGGGTIPAIFNGKKIVVSKSINVINGLVDEYSGAMNQVRMRWPMGLGKYLMDKVELSMAGKGILQVDKVSGKNGNFVYINGRSIGLSNKFDVLEQLGARMTTYEAVLAKLTAKISKVKTVHVKKPFYAKPP